MDGEVKLGVEGCQQREEHPYELALYTPKSYLYQSHLLVRGASPGCPNPSAWLIIGYLLLCATRYLIYSISLDFHSGSLTHFTDKGKGSEINLPKATQLLIGDTESQT